MFVALAVHALVVCSAALQEEPATSQLYVLCDMAGTTIKALAQRMQLDASLLTAKHPGGITLPVNFYRPLDKGERGELTLRCCKHVETRCNAVYC
jgi:hypothetical protein